MFSSKTSILVNKKLIRHASARGRKVPVQLLKDFEKFGKKGQIVQVLPSVMRNSLHPHNGACYILPNQGPRIPVVKIDTIELEREAEKRKLERQLLLEAKAKEEHVKNHSTGALSLTDLARMIQSKAPSRARTEEANNFISSEETIYNFETVNSLPQVYQIRSTTTNTGYLNNFMNKKNLSQRIFELTGAEVPLENIELSYVHESTEKVAVDELDFVGTYALSVKVPFDTRVVEKRIKVISSNDPSLALIRPGTSDEAKGGANLEADKQTA